MQTISDWARPKAGQRPVVCIDVWAKVQEPARKGETQYDRDYRLGGYVKWLCAETGDLSVIINHHLRKQGADDILDRLSGTTGLTGAADTTAILDRKRGEDTGRLTIESRLVRGWTVALRNFPYWKLDGTDIASAAARADETASREHLGDRSKRVLDLITAKGEVTTAEVAEDLRLASSDASTYLARLVISGQIKKVGRGMSVKWGVLVPSAVYVPSVPNPESERDKGTETTGDTSVRREDVPDFETLWDAASNEKWKSAQ